jgi:hypothetical protein
VRAHIASLGSFILGDYKYGVGCTKQFAHQVSKPLEVPLHLHLRRIVITNWFGLGKDLTVGAELPTFWRKSIMSSGHCFEDANRALKPNLFSPDEYKESKVYKTLKEQEERLKKLS